MRLEQYLQGKEDHKLCYVKDSLAYFTNIELSEQWGDDWNDSPYEYNAGEPYYDEPNQIIKIEFNGTWLQTPADQTYPNSPYSVEMINSGAIAWIVGSIGDKTVAIQAGATVEEFIAKMTELEESVYVPVNI